MKANETVVPPPGRPPLLNHHLLSAPAGYIQLMQSTWAQFPADRPSTDSCVQQLESIQMSHGLYSGTGRSAPAAQASSCLTLNDPMKHFMVNWDSVPIYIYKYICTPNNFVIEGPARLFTFDLRVPFLAASICARKAQAEPRVFALFL